MRALFNEISDRLQEGDYVYVAKASLGTTPYKTLQKDRNYMLKRLNVTKSAS